MTPAPARGRVDPRRDPGDQRPARPADGRPRLQHLGEEHQLRGGLQAARRARAATRSGGWSTSSSRGASRPDLRRLRLPRRGARRPRGATSRRRPSRPSTCSTAGSSSSRPPSSPSGSETEAGPDPARQAERAFRLAFGRSRRPPSAPPPSALIGSHGTAAFCRALYNANEFVYVP